MALRNYSHSSHRFYYIYRIFRRLHIYRHQFAQNHFIIWTPRSYCVLACSYGGLVALLAILVFSIVVQVSGAFLGGSVLPGRESLEVIDAYPSGWLSLTAYTGFLILSNLAINIANIYWASVAWELLVPKYVGKKEYLILGLIGVIWFVLIRSEHVHIFLATIGDIIIGCLACVFVMVFIADKLGHHRLMLSDKIIASIGWTIGSLAGLVYLIVFEGSQINSLFLGAAITSTLIGTLTTGRWLLGKSHSLVR